MEMGTDFITSIQDGGCEVDVPFLLGRREEGFMMHARWRVYLFIHSPIITGCLCGVEGYGAGPGRETYTTPQG